jgi:hypothetical protein
LKISSAIVSVRTPESVSPVLDDLLLPHLVCDDGGNGHSVAAVLNQAIGEAIHRHCAGPGERWLADNPLYFLAERIQ